MSTTCTDDLPGERQQPRRRALNFWIDLITAVQFSALLGTGALMKWVLPPGTCDAPVLKTWLGHARHWWGDIHFWIAVSLIAAVLVHLYLHWKWVVIVWARLVGPVRSPKTWALTVLMAGLLAVPWLIPPQSTVLPDPAGAGQPAGAAPAGLAPCGIPGLSCETCPAAGDRLFAPASGSKSGKDPAKAGERGACETCPEGGDSRLFGDPDQASD